jgi:hypothetical protein
MKLSERVLSGLQRGVDRHWRFSKNLLRIKPEYLLTVSVADALAEGFDGIAGLEVEIELEAATRSVCTDLLLDEVGWRRFFATIKATVSREGRVDLYVKHERKCWIVELKGFDPSAREIKKDVVRLREFLAANRGENSCRGCLLAFPTTTDDRTTIESLIASLVPIADYTIKTTRVETGEDPEDGIPVYFANCISFHRVAVATDIEKVSGSR